MRHVLIAAAVLLLSSCSLSREPVVTSVTHPLVTAKDLGSLSWRTIGPAVMGGRLDVVAGVPGDGQTIYLGHSSGGLYQSLDGGLSFKSIFSEGSSSSIGALAVAPSDPKRLYLGTGEGFPRNTAAIGDGVFTSSDAGKTWHAIGLRDTQHIARIAVDPHDPNVVLVAALGPEWTPGGARGIYRSRDGGKTWQRTLAGNATTGASDVVFDPSDSRVVYAGLFDFLRRPWEFRGGGTGSGLFKSTDGGLTWARLTDPALHNGLPGGVINRVGVALCFHHPQTLYAVVPTKTGMLYRSDDAGAHWRSVNPSQDLNFRPFYFSQVRVDPDDPDRVYMISGELKLSTDGGKTFKGLDAGGDNHDLWVDPLRHDRVLLGSDMGFDLSMDRAKSWDYINTVPFGQVYRVAFDSATPYHVMGGMQDHEVWWGPSSLWNADGAGNGDWRNVSDWGDGQYVVPDPRDPDVLYEDTHFGDLTRRNLRTGEARYISPQPRITFGTGVGKFTYRFNWSAPLLLSAHDPNVLYYGGNVLFKSTDGGTNWSVISPDLSEPCDRALLRSSGGPISHDNTNAESYCTIYALSEDAVDLSTLWAGTDNGNLLITRDGGGHWTNLIGNVPGAPPRALVSSIHASRVDAGVAYVSFDAHRLGDTRPYVFATRDYGKTWTNLSRGLKSYVYAVREDPRARDLLFAGTEDGVWASFDRGNHWVDLRLGMEHVPVYDLDIQPQFNDLVLGTHGRGFAILDDITPLEHLGEAMHDGAALFAPTPAWRYTSRPSYDHGHGEYVAKNRPYGALISYYLAPKPHAKPRASKTKRARPAKEHVDLQILDQRGAVVRTIKDAPVDDGINRVTWDLTTDPPGGVNAVADPRSYYVFYPLDIDGPEVLPGTYTVRLRARGKTFTMPLEVRLDPAVTASTSDLQAQFDALHRLNEEQERGEVTLNKIAHLDHQIDAAVRKAKDNALRRSLRAYKQRIDAVADRLRNGDGSQNAGYKQPAQVIDQIAYLRHIIATSFDAPTQAQSALIDEYARVCSRVVAQADALFGQNLTELNGRLHGEKLRALDASVTKPTPSPKTQSDP